MTGIIIGGAVAILVSVIGGIAGITQLMKFIQDSATGLAKAETFEVEVVKLGARVASLEEKVGRVERDNSALIDQNMILIQQTNKLTEQNGYLMKLLGDDTDTEAIEVENV